MIMTRPTISIEIHFVQYTLLFINIYQQIDAIYVLLPYIPHSRFPPKVEAVGEDVPIDRNPAYGEVCIYDEPVAR